MTQFESNRNARINERDFGRFVEIQTQGRDEGSLTARVNVRERPDVETGRSLQGLSIRTAGGRNIRFDGFEANTILRALERAKYGF